ncbi:hypothetical protein PMAYCL1PPCAC_32177, partial [Pristionchus mayeri]
WYGIPYQRSSPRQHRFRLYLEFQLAYAEVINELPDEFNIERIFIEVKVESSNGDACEKATSQREKSRQSTISELNTSHTQLTNLHKQRINIFSLEIVSSRITSDASCIHVASIRLCYEPLQCPECESELESIFQLYHLHELAQEHVRKFEQIHFRSNHFLQ